MNRDYCYIDDVLETKNKGEFDPEKYCYDKDCGRKSLDPDCRSHRLYEDLAKVFGGKTNYAENELLFSKTEETELTDEEGRRYGSDYIGPSWNWARLEYGFTDREIGEGLKRTRLLGGHMLWLRKTPSINTTKGGKGIYDRFDLCLDELSMPMNVDLKGHPDINSLCGRRSVKKKNGLNYLEEDGKGFQTLSIFSCSRIM